MANIAWVILAFSALLCAVITMQSLAFANDATCGPAAPVEYRHEVLLVGLVAYAACAIPAVILIRVSRTPGLVLAIILACCSLGPPALSYLFALFSSALC